MGHLKKLSIALIIVVLVAAGLIYFGVWHPEVKPISVGLADQATIQKATYDNTTNTLTVTTQSMSSKTITFNTAIIKDSKQITINTIAPFQIELPPNQQTTIPIDLTDYALKPGNYTVDLWTSNSYVFRSPIFTIT